jgi:hypothetical protein
MTNGMPCMISHLREIIVEGVLLKHKLSILLLVPLLTLALGACAGVPATIKALSDLGVPGFNTYKPTAEIEQLADAAMMSGKARQIFYAAQPEIDMDRAAFEQHCHAPVATTAVELGCYTSQNRVYLLNISEPRLSDEMVVVAAHEMLHAAYGGLSRADSDALTPQLEAALSKIHSTELTQRLRDYRASEPLQRENELHSIIGTEFAPLDPPLEQYYSQYFTRRSDVVADEQQFQLVFSGIQDTMNGLHAQIEKMRRDMDTAQRQKRIPTYNALVPKYNSLIKQYNQTVARYNALSRSLIGEESIQVAQ